MNIYKNKILNNKYFIISIFIFIGLTSIYFDLGYGFILGSIIGGISAGPLGGIIGSILMCLLQFYIESCL